MRADAVVAPWLTIVGVGEDGYVGLGPAARAALARADVIAGSARTLGLLDADERARAVAWPSPMMAFVDDLLARERARGRAVAIVASGDPMFFGIGGSIARRIDAREFAVYPQPSCFALACARLGWPQEDVAAISVVSRPLERVRAALYPGRRLVVLCEDGTTPASLASLLVAGGFGETKMTCFEALGGPRERRLDASAATWSAARVDDLNVVALDLARDAVEATPADAIGCVPGLPDAAYESDGALTKAEARAISLAKLAPRPGELLWDIGAGSGSIGIEWMRAHVACRAIAFERDAVRAERIARNARALGVPDLRIVVGDAPATLANCGTPDAIFIGGGISVAGVLPAALLALRSGGRIVANAVTLEAELVLLDAYAKHGGTLARIAIERASPVGTMSAWRPAMPLVQWTYRT